MNPNRLVTCDNGTSGDDCKVTNPTDVYQLRCMTNLSFLTLKLQELYCLAVSNSGLVNLISLTIQKAESIDSAFLLLYYFISNPLSVS